MSVRLTGKRLSWRTSISAASDRLKSALSVASKRFFLAIDDDGNFVSILDSISARVQKFSAFINAHKADIQNFFVGVKDTVYRLSFKGCGVLSERLILTSKRLLLKFGKSYEAIGTLSLLIASAFANAVWALLRPVLVFVKEHPKLVATVLTGIIALKAYRFATNTVSIGYDLLAGGVSLLQGHYHKLNATVIGNQRALAKVGSVSVSTGRKFLDMGKGLANMKFPRFSVVLSADLDG